MNNILIRSQFRNFIVIIIVLIVGFISGYECCKFKTSILTQKLEIIKTGNQVNESDDELQKKVLFNGDSLAYEQLHIKHFEDKYYGGTLLYDIIMANKYSYNEAYFRVYDSLTANYEHRRNCGNIDDKTLNLALKYLFKGVELNNLNCIKTLSNLYREGIYINRDSVKSAYYNKKAIELISE